MVNDRRSSRSGFSPCTDRQGLRIDKGPARHLRGLDRDGVCSAIVVATTPDQIQITARVRETRLLASKLSFVDQTPCMFIHY